MSLIAQNNQVEFSPNIQPDNSINILGGIGGLQIIEEGPIPVITLLKALDMRVPNFSINKQHRADQLYEIWISLCTTIRKTLQNKKFENKDSSGHHTPAKPHSITSGSESRGDPILSKLGPDSFINFKPLKVENNINSATGSPLVHSIYSSTDSLNSLKLAEDTGSLKLSSTKTSPSKVISGSNTPDKISPRVPEIQIKRRLFPPGFEAGHNKRVFMSDSELKDYIKKYFDDGFCEGKSVSDSTNHFIRSNVEILNPEDIFIYGKVETIINNLMAEGIVNFAKQIKVPSS